MTFFPLSSDNDNDPRSDFTSVKSGALVPFEGRFPKVFTGFPLNVIFAITFFSNLINLFQVKTLKCGVLFS
jgi:hypothetical protein